MWMLDDTRFLRGMILLILVIGGLLLANLMLAASGKRSLAEYEANPCPPRSTGDGIADAITRAKEVCPPKKQQQSQ